jgi:geranylgeranyl diphosphate synthase type I
MSSTRAGFAGGLAAAAFAELLAEVRPEIERRLARAWAVELRAVRGRGPDVESMALAARDLTMRGGKRFRAALVAAAHLGVAPRAALGPALDAGAALELLQTYLLAQDDWIDGDATRRGGPSVHAALAERLGDARLGDVSAILASDLTWGLALRTLASVELSPKRVVAAIELLASVHRDVVVGQQLDVLGRAEDVEAMHALKTGSYTVRGPLLLGATLAGAPPATMRSLERYAAPLGVAFQLRDDLLGAFGTTAETGKPLGGDLRTGKRTAVLAEAEVRLDAAGRRAIDRVLGRADASDEEIVAATGALGACGAREAVTTRLGKLCDRSGALAARLPLAPRARAALAGAAEALRWPPQGSA